MIRSLNTAVLGIKQFQTSLDAIGNNLANINTIGYKTARVDFSDTLAQTMRAPTPDTGIVSGTAGMQLGNGVKVAAIKNEFSQGAIKQTGVRTDMAITGDGFFLVKDSTTSELFVTRAGDFREDKNGYLVTNDGYRVQGLNKQAPANTVAEKTEIGDIKLDVGSYTKDRTSVSLATDTNIFTKIAHGYSTGNQVSFNGASPGVGSGIITSSTVYFVAKATSDTFTLHGNAADAASGSNEINFVDSSVVPTGPVAQQDRITITAGNHDGDTFTVTANGQTTTAIPSAATVTQISQIVINASNGVAAGTTYSVEITDGATYTVTEGVDFTASGGNDTTLVRDALIAKINAGAGDPTVTASATLADRFILTGKVAGTSFYATPSETDTTAGNGVGCHVLTPTDDQTTRNNETAAAINTAVNALNGLSSTVIGNVITITADGSGKALTGPTSITLANTDGGDAPVPAVTTLTNTNGSQVLVNADHGLVTGNTVYLQGGTGELPGGLTEGQKYFVNVSTGVINTNTNLTRGPLSTADKWAGSNSQVLTCELGGNVGTLIYRWDHFSAADKVEIYYEGQKIWHTGSNPLTGNAETVSGTGSANIPINGTSTELKIMVNDGILSSGTVWNMWFDGGLSVTPKSVSETASQPNGGSSISFHNSAEDAATGTNAVNLTTTGADYSLYKDEDTITSLTLSGGASIASYSMGADGKVNMLLTDGTQYVRGQIMLQDFNNPQALLKQGSNLFGNLATAGPIGSESGSSGATDILRNAKEPGSSGVGRIAAGALELSNVDMAREFSNMITTQRAFQANARMVTTSDEILKEMMALKR